jgi:hypothetical protein
MRFIEIFTLKVGIKTVKIYNDGIKKFKEMSDLANAELKSYLDSEIDRGQTKGWLPYNNFECSIHWKLL